MARPKKEEELARSHRITVRLSDVEYETITEAAKEAHMSVSAYIRRMLCDGQINIRYHIVADMPEVQKLATEIARVGNNLNQISKYFHMGGTRSMIMQQEIHKCMEELHGMREIVVRLGGDYSGDYQAYSD